MKNNTFNVDSFSWISFVMHIKCVFLEEFFAPSKLSSKIYYKAIKHESILSIDYLTLCQPQAFQDGHEF